MPTQFAGSYLVPRTQNAEALEDIDVADYKIVCKNKLPCFFTRHFLYFQNIRDVESLYCVSCKEERPIPYCEN